MTLADGETRKFWAGNNTPGKKGFQPKAGASAGADANGVSAASRAKGGTRPDVREAMPSMSREEAATVRGEVTSARFERTPGGQYEGSGHFEVRVPGYVNNAAGNTRVHQSIDKWEAAHPDVRLKDGMIHGETKPGSGIVRATYQVKWGGDGFKSVAIPGAPKKATVTAGRYSRRSGQVLGDATSRGRSLSGGGYRIVALPTGRGTKVVLVPAADVKEL